MNKETIRENHVTENHPLPNPFLAGWMVEDARRQRIAENEQGKEEHETEQEIPNQ